MLDSLVKYAFQWSGTIFLTFLTSIFVTVKIWKNRNRMCPPPGVSNGQQSVEIKGKKGVYKSALLKDSPYEYLTTYMPGVTTLFEGFLNGLEKSKNGRCLGYRPTKGAPYQFMSYAEVYKNSREIGSAFINLFDLKAVNDTHVGIYAKNCPEWIITSLACVRYSMVTVPLYDTLGADAAAFVVRQTEIEVIVVDEINKIKKLLDSADQMPTLKHIVCITVEPQALESLKSSAKSQNIQLHVFDTIRQLGAAKLVEDVPPKPEDTFIVCYTSGTTGVPKGVVLSHKNIVANCSAFFKIMVDFEANIVNPNQIIVSYLPLAHMFEQMNHWCSFTFGGAVGYYSGDVAGLMDDLQALKPTIFPVVPRLIHKLVDTIQGKVNNLGFIQRTLFNFAYWQKKMLLKDHVITKNSIWDKLVFHKIQAQLGSECRLMITGSAPVSAEALEICRVVLGAMVVEGYGQTEYTAIASFTWPNDPSGGHCGGVAPCAVFKLGDVPELDYYASQGKGEILIKGPCVTSGYYKDPEKTAEIFDEEGYLKTGDVGQLLPNGAFKIIDRRKHIFKLSQGEYVAPEKIENVYVRSLFVQQIFVDGDSLERFLVAIVVPEPSSVKQWYKKTTGNDATFDEICSDQKTIDHILADLTKIGKENRLNHIEQVKTIYLETTPFSIENGLLTPTLKSKRPPLRLKYKETISELYKNAN